MPLLKRLVCLFGLLAGLVCPLCAQDWTPEDSLRLRRLLEGDGEIKLNPHALKELERSFGRDFAPYAYGEAEEGAAGLASLHGLHALQLGPHPAVQD